MKRNSRQKGFTLIELIIVIAIIAILAAIAVPAFGNIISKSKQTAFYATADRLMKAMNTYVTMHDEEIRENGGYNVNVVGTADGDAYQWQVYTGTASFEPMMVIMNPSGGGKLVYDSEDESKQVLSESFGDYLDSIMDPFSGKPFNTIILHYSMEYEDSKYNSNIGGYINLTVSGNGYVKGVDNQTDSDWVLGALPGEE